MDIICRNLSDGGSLVYVWFYAMHTRMDIVAWDLHIPTKDIKSICAEVEEEVRRIERMGSCFIPDSELSGINASAPDCAVDISEELYQILSRCISYNRSTGGYFDVTASEGSITCVVDSLSLRDGSVARRRADVKINLSGFLKGYALDKAAAKFRMCGIRNALLNFGNSSVCGLGNHPEGEGWIVETLADDRFILKDTCLTTSGNAGREETKIINPLTGEAILGKGMVSVVTSTAEEGEVQSTVRFIKNNIKTFDIAIH